MQQLVYKNQELKYRSIEHEILRDRSDSYYCRAVHAILPKEVELCRFCPLLSGFYPNHKCRYYDLAGTEKAWKKLSPTPRMEKERVDALIAAGVTKLFPDYLAEYVPAKRSLVEEAIALAAEAHYGTWRKGNAIPYIAHPMETMFIVAGFTKDEEVIAAAALHDVVEDTPVTLDDIRKQFGDRVAELVGIESENKREGIPKAETWKIRKEENLIREHEAPLEAKMIMLADKVSNMRATLSDFRKEGPQIWDKFNMKDESQQAWYYKSVAKLLQPLSDFPIYDEYLAMVEEVFEGVDTPPLLEFPIPDSYEFASDLKV